MLTTMVSMHLRCLPAPACLGWLQPVLRYNEVWVLRRSRRNDEDGTADTLTPADEHQEAAAV